MKEIAARAGLFGTLAIGCVVSGSAACSSSDAAHEVQNFGAGAPSAAGASGASSGASSTIAGGSSNQAGSAGTSSNSGGSAGSAGLSAAAGAGGASGVRASFYVSPNGTGSACSSSAPCSITQAQSAVRAATSAMQNDLSVELADGVYVLSAPLSFNAADSGMNGQRVIWQAASGAHPVLSGGKSIGGWSVSDAGKNIWKAAAPSSFVTRQLYVDGKLATRARSASIKRADLSVNATGFTFSNSSLNFLKTLAHPERAELNAIGSWTNRYCRIQSVANTTVTMAQPAWEENTWGYDTVQDPYRQGPVYVENDSTLLDQPGEWYQDTGAGLLYYIPLSGQDMSKVDVELPQLELLLALGGSYQQPAHDLEFRGLTFAYTSWIGPNAANGFADQQTGGFISGPRSLYPAFEATRPAWHQMPAAVQVSAAHHISFLRDRFLALGSVALGIGNDDNAHQIGVGLGASAISVTGCVFSQIAGGGIVIGGIQAKAHHPGGDVAPAALSPAELALVNHDLTVSDNLVHDIGIDYRDFSGILFTYTQKVSVTHNEIYNVPYSGICSGYGWGTNDAGGNAEYKSRATGNLYQYQPLYANATIAMNNTISANFMHLIQLQMNDGGCHYHLGANPGTVVTENYCEGKGSGLSGVVWGEYADEGSAYLSVTKNVFANFGYYVTANANASNNTGHLTFSNNWGPSANPTIAGPGNVIMGNVAISGDTFPADAQSVVKAAGLEAAYADLKTAP